MKRKGFSLLEILLGCIIFSSIVVLACVSWGLHARTVGHTRARSMATFIAGQEIENCITLGFRGVDTLRTGSLRQQEMTSIFNGVRHTNIFNCIIYSADPAQADLRGKLKLVTVRVTYDEGTEMGGKREVVYQTYIAEAQ